MTTTIPLPRPTRWLTDPPPAVDRPGPIQPWTTGRT